MRRADKRRGDGGADRFEGEALAFHERLRDGFLTLAANEPDRCVLIDATASKEEVAEQIWRVVAEAARSRHRADRNSRMRRVMSAGGRQRRWRDRRIRARHSVLFGHAEAEQTLLDAYRGGRIPHAWLIGGETRHRQGDARLSHGALRAGASRSGGCPPCRRRHRSPFRRIIRSRGASPGRRTAISWCSSASSTKRPASCSRSSRVDDVRRTRAVLRLDRGRGRLARRDRRSAGRPQQGRRERAAEGAGGAAAACAAAAGQPCAGPRAADHPLALPPLDAAPARRRGRRARDGRGAAARARAPTKSAPRPAPPTDRSDARWRCSRATRLNCASRSIGLLDRLPAARSARAACARRRDCRHRGRNARGVHGRRQRLAQRPARKAARRTSARLARVAEVWDSGQPRGARGRGLQSRPQTAGVFGVRAVGRSRAGLSRRALAEAAGG